MVVVEVARRTKYLHIFYFKQDLALKLTGTCQNGSYWTGSV